MFIGGRFLTGLGCTTASTSAKSYLAEITSPSNRGRWMGLLNSFYYVGQIIASGISIPFGRTTSEYAWRAPIYLQAMFAIVNVAFVMFLPESPRWLYTRGKKERAVAILAKLHSRDNNINSPLVQLEIQEIEENISLSGADKRFWDFRALFRTAAARYRFMLCAIVSCWGQLSGNGLITYFLPTLLKQAGIISPDRQRVLNFVNSVTSFVGALTGTVMVDHVGRRKLMLFSAVSCMCGMAIVAALLSPSGAHNSMRANAGISFICASLFPSMIPLTSRSPVHGVLLLRMDATPGALPRRGPVVREPSERTRPPGDRHQLGLPHQHLRSPVRPSSAPVEEYVPP